MLMTKIRVYELAKELEMESKDVIRRLGKMGADMKNHMSAVEDKHAEMLRDIMRPKLILAEKLRAESAAAKKEEAAQPAEPEAKESGKVEPAAPGRPKQDDAKSEPTIPAVEKEVSPQPVSTPAPKTEGKESPEAAASGSDGSRPPSEEKKAAAEAAPGSQAMGQSPPAAVEGESLRAPRPQGQEGAVNRPQQSQNQNRPPQGQYQGRPQGSYQDRPQQGQGQYQNRPQQGQGQYQNRPQQGQGQYQNRSQQGQYQNRSQQGQGQYQNRSQQGQGQYQGRPQQGQGQYQNRPQQGQGQYQNRPQGQNQGRPQGPQGRPPQGQKGAPKPATDLKPPEKKEPRRFDQKKKTGYDNKKTRDNDQRNYDGNLRRRPNQKQKRMVREEAPPPVTPKTVVIGETVLISELAKSMGKTAAELIKKLMLLGTMATVNQEIDTDTAQILAGEFGVTVEVKVDKTMEIMEDDVDVEASLVKRPPVVTVMGHVDHGKTSLLDAIRKTNVIASEAGGITQHIGAYQVEVSGQKITFLDTPGHEAFTSMRARGAQATDIAILVVAADDGVMPQTVEAINHAKAAKVPIIVAINKTDKEGADIDRIKSQLSEQGLISEEWGGSTIMVPISAKKGIGIQNLLEMILLVAEVEDFKSNPDRNARGTILEAELDKGRGAVATVLVQKGTLKIGDILVAGTVFARVRAMIDDKGRRIKVALPSTPVEILGFSDVPPPGEIFVCVDDERDARHIADHNSLAKREKEMGRSAMVTLDDLFKQISEGIVKDLNIVVKADVQGSMEALCQSIKNLSTSEVRVNIIHSGVGGVAESDVMLAAASKGIIIGFNVRPDANTKKAAEREGVDIRMYRVIYEALDDIKAAMSGLLDPEYKEVVIGHVEVREVFKVPKGGFVAGCYVTSGKVTRNSKVRLLRDSVVVHEGSLASLRRFKDDVKEVMSGYECGIAIENFNDVKVGDQMELYILEETKRQI